MIKDIRAQNENVQPSDRVMEKLHADFPQCFTNEGKFDLEKFKGLLNDKVDVAEEGYDLNFLGKNYANLIASTETETVIQPDLEYNSKPENKDSQNIYISGDNLDALKHLLKSYSGKVKCIYIDPPYNTGSDGFVYNDKFNFTSEQIQTKLGVSEEKAKRILDLCKRGSASHSAWLMFMAPRLMLAKDLLTEDGVIFISIDDNEQANLKLLCDGVFGEENFAGQLIIQTATDNNPTQVSVEHEYMLSYVLKRECQNKWFIPSSAASLIQTQYLKLKSKSKSLEDIQFKLREWINKNKVVLPQVSHYNNVDARGVYSSSSNSSNTKPGGYMFDIVHPITNKPCAKPEYGWRWTEETFLNYKKNDDVEWGADEQTQPHIKKRVESATEQLKTIIYEDGRASTKLLESLFESKKIFDNPKPMGTLKRVLNFVTSKDTIVLDFFSGSATTAHAVMKLNAEDGGTRKFIMVQLPELTPKDSEARKAGYKTIDEIGQERIRRASAKIKSDLQSEIEKKEFELKAKEEKLAKASQQKNMFEEENPLVAEIEALKSEIETKKETLQTMDFGFKHYILKDVPQNTLDKMETFDVSMSNAFADTDILHSFGKETVLETWLVKDGYGLGAKVNDLHLNNYTAYHCGSHLYFVEGENFDEKAMVALIDKYGKEGEFNPQNVVLFGYSFTFTQTEMLKKNLATLKDSKKNLNINIDICY